MIPSPPEVEGYETVMAPMLKWKQVAQGLGNLKNMESKQPKSRHGHRAVAIKDLIVVFGGGNDGMIDDLHVFNTSNNQWFMPAVKGDIPMGYAAHGFVVEGTRMLLFGGMMEYGKYSNDLYELQATRWEWKQLRPKAPKNGKLPCPRLGHSFTIVGNRTYLFGGLENASGDPRANIPHYLDDLFALECSIDNVAWDEPTTFGPHPCARESHTGVAYTSKESGNSYLVIFGGMNGVRLGDVWMLDCGSMTWTNPVMGGSPPMARSLHCASMVGHRMYIFGGWVSNTQRNRHRGGEWRCADDLTRLDLETLTWEQVPVDLEEGVPPPRAGTVMVNVDSRQYVWSGRDGYKTRLQKQVCFDDMWCVEVEIPRPPGRAQLLRTDTNSLELTWTPAGRVAEHYVLDVMLYSHPPVASSPFGSPAHCSEMSQLHLLPSPCGSSGESYATAVQQQVVATTTDADGKAIRFAPPVRVDGPGSVRRVASPEANEGVDCFRPSKRATIVSYADADSSETVSKAALGPGNDVIPGPGVDASPGPADSGSPEQAANANLWLADNVSPGTAMNGTPESAGTLTSGQAENAIPEPAPNAAPGPADNAIPGPANSATLGPANTAKPGPTYNAALTPLLSPKRAGRLPMAKPKTPRAAAKLRGIVHLPPPRPEANASASGTRPAAHPPVRMLAARPPPTPRGSLPTPPPLSVVVNWASQPAAPLSISQAQTVIAQYKASHAAGLSAPRAHAFSMSASDSLARAPTQTCVGRPRNPRPSRGGGRGSRGARSSFGPAGTAQPRGRGQAARGMAPSVRGQGTTSGGPLLSLRPPARPAILGKVSQSGCHSVIAALPGSSSEVETRVEDGDEGGKTEKPPATTQAPAPASKTLVPTNQPPPLARLTFPSTDRSPALARKKPAPANQAPAPAARPPSFVGKPMMIQLTKGAGGKQVLTLVPTTDGYKLTDSRIQKGIMPVDPQLPRVLVVPRKQSKADAMAPGAPNNKANGAVAGPSTAATSGVAATSGNTVTSGIAVTSGQAVNGVGEHNEPFNKEGTEAAVSPGAALKFPTAAVKSPSRPPVPSEAKAKAVAPPQQAPSDPPIPGPPIQIKIAKLADGAHLSWSPAPGDAVPPSEYAVYMAVRSFTSPSGRPGNALPPLAFVRVYLGPEPRCTVADSVLKNAHVDNRSRPALIYRIASRNGAGFGPATQVKWLQRENVGVLKLINVTRGKREAEKAEGKVTPGAGRAVGVEGEEGKILQRLAGQEEEAGKGGMESENGEGSGKKRVAVTGEGGGKGKRECEKLAVQVASDMEEVEGEKEKIKIEDKEIRTAEEGPGNDTEGFMEGSGTKVENEERKGFKRPANKKAEIEKGKRMKSDENESGDEILAKNEEGGVRLKKRKSDSGEGKEDEEEEERDKEMKKIKVANKD